MAQDRTTFGNRISQGIIKGVLGITVPLFHHKILPKRWIPLGGIVSSKYHGNIVLIECDNGFLEIKIITSTIWRIRASKTALPIEHKSFAAIEPQNNSRLKIMKQYGFLQIKEDKSISSRSDIIIKVHEADSSVIFDRVDGSLLSQDYQSISWSKRGSWGKIIKCSNTQEHHIGFGEKTGKLIKNGKKMIFWNTDPTGYDTRGDPLYQSEPLQVSIREDGSAYGIFYDNPHYSVIKLDKGLESKVNYFTETEPLCYYVFTGPTLKDVSKQIAILNGKLPFPPRWVLGYHQSRWSYYSEEEVRELAKNFRDKGIPCDSVHLDIDYMNEFRCFTWDPVRFPNPKRMIHDLLNDGFKSIVMTDPGLKVDQNWIIYRECIENDYHCKLPSGQPYQGAVWPGKCIFPDFTHPITRGWWGKLFQNFLDVGIEGFWLDMAEPSIFDIRRTFPGRVMHNMDDLKGNHRDAHNIYGNMFAKATREGLHGLRGNLRTFIFVRAAYSGIQRYAATWTGDNYSTWGSLRQSIPMVINMGLSGQPFVGVDLGGFSFNTTPELLIRWYQIGIFYPYCRNHSANGTRRQEPWAFGDKVEKTIKKLIELRYQLLPYLYTVLHEAITLGLPMMRPLFMEFPTDKETYNEKWHNSQFLIGNRLLITPILKRGIGEKNSVKHEIYLPEGKWVDFWTVTQYQGKQIIKQDISLDHFPLFVLAGSVIPMGPIVPHVEKTIEHPITLAIYPDNEISGIIYLDDGLSLDYSRGKYTTLIVKGNETSKALSIEVSQSGELTDLPTTNNNLHFKVFTERTPKEIRVNDNIAKENAETENIYWKIFHNNNYEIIIIKPDFPIDVQINY